jgi:cell wall-associated NlpC family hydrolase
VKLRSRTASLRRRGLLAALTIATVAALGAAPGNALAAAGSGGTSTAPDAPAGETAELLDNGDAVAPEGAPPEVVRAIEFANRINRKPYVYGGGHQSWKLDRGYDCSGAVSYMLHGARVLKSPLPSGDLAKWGYAGEGEWISVYANKGHAYAVVAGLRWDTSGGKGPRWHEGMRSAKGYAVRHAEGL